MEATRERFETFFERAVGKKPFVFQKKFALDAALPQLVNIPTGLGKTAMVVLGWLWRRRNAHAETPRRLVYCLPMRVLVEQTANSAKKWIEKLKDAGYFTDGVPKVYVLMGGENEDDWDLHPEREAIIVGTQDMLLSRALNRGYAASRSRWPIQFGMLHSDCLWVFDEVQLMGPGLATTAQLEAFRRSLPRPDAPQAKSAHGCQSVCMSATLDKDWLETVDFKPSAHELTFDYELETTGDRETESLQPLVRRWEANKALEKASKIAGEPDALSRVVLEKHPPGTRTIIVLNTVAKARNLYKALSKVLKRNNEAPNLILLHSRFRPGDRERQVEAALTCPGGGGSIIVSTQVIEAGVDISAATLFTELAPWASLVQRFGRCNRYGKHEDASVYWIDLPEKKAETAAAPYAADEIETSRARLAGISDVGLRSLAEIDAKLPFKHTHVIRRKDLIELFDTTPDLAGYDIDIDRFVRDVEGSDVHLFWRDWDRPHGNERPPDEIPSPHREELCSAPLGEFREFAKKHSDSIWRWNFLEERWEKSDQQRITPGQIFLIHADAGGYVPERGWDPDSKTRVEPLQAVGTKPDGTDQDPLSRIGVWQSLADHAEEVAKEVERICEMLSLSEFERSTLIHAARWHDRGKAHEIFQKALPEDDDVSRRGTIWAKAPSIGWKKYKRPHFRHELASALAVLLASKELIPQTERDLVAYIVAAHHGKVRLSIRSLPGESRPSGQSPDGSERRFARGIWDGDELPAVDLGGGVTSPPVVLSLEPMELGLCEHPPFENQPSWVERVIRLRDTWGPFRLAYFEAILRAADMRASRAAELNSRLAGARS